MVVEVEPRRLRRGDSGKKPYGGNVSNEPFPRALHEMASSRGFETQTSLSRTINIDSSRVSIWYRGINTPTPEMLGELLVLFDNIKPLEEDENYDKLIDSYGKLLIQGKGQRFNIKGSERALITGQSRMNKSESPIGQWIEDICKERSITLTQFAEKLNFTQFVISHRDQFSIGRISDLLLKAPEIFGLSDDEASNLSEAVEESIEQKTKDGHRFQNTIGHVRLTRLQETVPCKTYNGQEAADKLKVTRETIRVKRKKFGLPILLTAEDLEDIDRDIQKRPLLHSPLL